MTAQSISLEEAIYNCRAMRRLDTREVPEALLIKLVDAANQAPSGSNAQIARWVIVRDAKVKKALADLNRAAVKEYIGDVELREFDDPRSPAAKRQRLVQSVLWQTEHMHEIPALIIACVDYGEKVSGMDIYRRANSVWPGIQNLLLMARALGLGAAPTTLALRDQDAARAALELPERFSPQCLIPVGYPLGKFGPVTRRPLSEVMRFDRWS